MTAYFSAFPQINYKNRVVQDITIRLDFLQRIKDNIALFEFRILQDGERPEDVALDVYGDTNLYWIILYMNDIIDPYHDWLLTEERLLEFITAKYGAENVYAVHHYETNDQSELGAGVWASLGTPFIDPVTNYDYEASLNEEKRTIKVLKNDYVSQVIAEYKKELRERDNE